MSAHTISLVVHGHFYQPPRENPWIGLLERQDSARPYHDWNERIAAECYTANAFARILDDAGRIIGIVNNYELISFNIGPTLLSWIEQHTPDTYARILAADATSRLTRGHGNALAQAYNHAILPLCNDRDRRTQVRWGLLDFEARFGRRPEAMWLPETAVNVATLDAVIDEGLRFLVLSPHQVEAAREEPGEWFDVSTGSIDPTQPYRVFVPGGRSIDVFFYDGPVSSAIGFEGALRSSGMLTDRLFAAVSSDRERDQLIHVATDGESYGHHTRFGERTLAYALAVDAPQRGFHVTNYGAYLAAHPPTAEARLKPGPSGEGTAWSCAHGVGRWARDCGCSAGRAGWHQRWRAPLRRALDLVRDRSSALYEARAGSVLKAPWGARDAYASTFVGPGGVARFLAEHGVQRPDGAPADATLALQLLEMERYAQLMYTSCGWFFDEISGLEGTQVLRYASRTIEAYEALSGEALEPDFLQVLAEAPSNVPELDDGAELYRRHVMPSRVDAARLTAQQAILGQFVGRPRQVRIGDYTVARSRERRAGDTRLSLATGRMVLRWEPTGETHELAYAVFHVGAADVCCAVAPFVGAAPLEAALDAVWREWPGQSIARILRAIERGFGPAEHTVRDLVPEERERVLLKVYEDLLEGIDQQYTRLYDNHRHTLRLLREAGLPIPEPLKLAAEMVIGARFEAEIARQRRSRDPARYRRALQMAREARERGLTLARPTAQRAFSEMLCDVVQQVADAPGAETAREAMEFLALSRRLGIDPVSAAAQERLYATLVARPELEAELRPLARELGFGELRELDGPSAAPATPAPVDLALPSPP